MKFNSFINDVKNKGGVDTDGYYGKQCMDLYNYYCRNVLGLTGNTGADCAKNIIKNNYVMGQVERINNYPAFIPQKGDIAVWTGGTYGHVAICLGQADVNTFKTLDQNWVSQKLTEENHNYTYLAPLVFLRPKNQSNIIDEIKTVEKIVYIDRPVEVIKYVDKIVEKEVKIEVKVPVEKIVYQDKIVMREPTIIECFKIIFEYIKNLLKGKRV